MLVSPAEPAHLREIGESSPLPENLGADFIPHAPVLCGVQRKTVEDLVASVADGRLARELDQLEQLPLSILLVEGPHWTASAGLFTPNPTSWDRKRWWGLQSTVLWKGIAWVEVMPRETIPWLRHLETWLCKEDHQGLARPSWDGQGDFGVHLLQSFPGIGPATARAIIKHCGVPFRLTVTEEELAAIPGVGQRRARTIVGAMK